MTRILRSPALWLLVAQTLVALFLVETGQIKAQRVPDTKGYVQLSDPPSWSGALADYRTLGYPLFLRLVLGEKNKLTPVPYAHLAVYFGSVLLLWWAVARFTQRPWLAFAGVLPLLASRSLTLLNRVQPDMLAVALALATVALLLRFSASPGNRLLATALATVLFATYQVRPAYLFLIVLLPMAAPVLRLCRERGNGSLSPRALGRWSVGVTLLALGPFLLFCTLRWAVVGQFGLVSFGGYNVVGLAASMIDEELVEELPRGHRPLARNLLDRRTADGLVPLTPDGLTRKWYSQFNANVWQRAVPLLEERLGPRSESSFAINRELSALSKNILLRRPGLYRKWVVDSFAYGFADSMEDLWIVGLGLALLLTSPLLLLASSSPPRGDPAAWPELVSVAFVAGLYLAGSLGLIVLVEVPFDRYIVTVAVLVPTALAMALFEVLRLSRLRLQELRPVAPTHKKEPRP